MYTPRAAGRTLVTESTNAAAMKQELDFYRGGCIQEPFCEVWGVR